MRKIRIILMLAALLVAAACSSSGSTNSSAGASSGAKDTYTIVTSNDPSRYMFYYALQHDLIHSDTVNLKVAYLPFAAAIAAAQSKQYPIVESNLVTTAQQQAAGLGTKIFSPGLTDTGTTVIIVPKNSPITSPSQLKGKKVGTVSLATSYMLEARDLLSRNFGLNTSLTGGDIQWSPITSPTALLATLQSGGLAAAVTNGSQTYTALYAQPNSNFRVLYPVTSDFRAIAAGPSISSTFNMYTSPDSVKAADVPEVRRMIAASYAYFQRNESSVIAQVASEQGVSAALLKWEAGLFGLQAGPFNGTQKTWFTTFLGVAAQLGSIKSAPPLANLITG
jgi:ABC-type nitrate/sulfonate/bicarbonate transport system substrate-binding protein